MLGRIIIHADIVVGVPNQHFHLINFIIEDLTLVDFAVSIKKIHDPASIFRCFIFPWFWFHKAVGNSCEVTIFVLIGSIYCFTVVYYINYGDLEGTRLLQPLWLPNVFSRRNITVHSCCRAAITLGPRIKSTTADLLNFGKQYLRRFNLFLLLLGRHSKVNLPDLHWVTMKVHLHRCTILLKFWASTLGRILLVIVSRGLFLIEMAVHVNMYLSLNLNARLPFYLKRLLGFLRGLDWISLAVIHGWDSVILSTILVLFIEVLGCLDVQIVVERYCLILGLSGLHHLPLIFGLQLFLRLHFLVYEDLLLDVWIFLLEDTDFLNFVHAE